MFKVTNKRVYNKVVRSRKSQPIVVETIIQKPFITETVKKIETVEEIVKPLDVTPEVIAPIYVEPEVIDTKAIMEEITSAQNGLEYDNEDNGKPITEEKPKKNRKAKTQKKDTEE